MSGDTGACCLNHAQQIEQMFPGHRVIEVNPLSGGISAEMTAFTLEHPDGRRAALVLRIQGTREFAFDPTATTRMYRTLAALAPQLPVVPKPYFLDPDGEFFGTPCLVMTRIDGRADYAREFGPAFSTGAAGLLALIHAIDPAPLDFLPRFSDWVQWQLENPPAAADTDLHEADIRAHLQDHWPFPHPNRPTLLHGDYWPGNLLWQEEELVGVVDWEETAIGDPLSDLAVARLDILFAFGQEVMADFTRRFLAASRQVDPADLPLWDLYAALRPAGELEKWAEGWPAFGRPDVTYTSMQKDQNWFVEQALSRARKV